MTTFSSSFLLGEAFCGIEFWNFPPSFPSILVVKILSLSDFAFLSDS